MAIGRIGETGIHVVSHAPVEPRVDLELVPILHHEMEAVNAVGRAKTYSLAMKCHAQVNIFFSRGVNKGSTKVFVLSRWLLILLLPFFGQLF